jgi:hypothetical protein
VCGTAAAMGTLGTSNKNIDNMKIHLTILFFLFTPFLFAQVNLVPNPSFEEHDTCPNNFSEIYFATNWFASRQTPDYYNTCATYSYVSVPSNFIGYQVPASGNAYVGIAARWPNDGWAEVIGTQLISPLTIGVRYYVSIKVSSSGQANPWNYCAINKLGALFSNVHYIGGSSTPGYGGPFPSPRCDSCAQVYTDSIITDTLNWTRIKGSFVADSNYSFINIGRFNTNATTDSIEPYGNVCFAYYFIDDICVSTDSAYSTDYVWTGINESDKLSDFNIYPNPAANELTIDCALTDKSYFELYDLVGAKRKEVTLDCGSLTERIDLSDIDSGLYFYSVVDRKGNRIKTGKLIIIK